MDITGLKHIMSEKSFNQYPLINTGIELVSDLLNYEEADIDLKIFLCEMILCRSFYGTYTAWPQDVNWFLTGFLKELENDLIKPELTTTIKEAGAMILSGEFHSKGIIGCSFMFGVLEFYAKYELGFRPRNFNFFDKRKKDYIKNYDRKQLDLSIRSAFIVLQKQNFPISQSLNNIDNFTISRLSEAGIADKEWIRYKIADRLSLARNPLLHGEDHNFSGMGIYVLMLYCLFHLTRLQLNQNELKKLA